MRFKRIFIFIVLSLLFLGNKPYEDVINLTGHWKGFLWQTQGGIARKYGFEMQIVQDDSRISGTTYIYLLEKSKDFAKINFWGTFKQRTANFKEQRILQQRINNGEWCIKTASLRYEKKNQKKILSGTWFGCKTAHTQEDRIYLEKTK